MRSNDYTIHLFLNMYDGGFVAHNILRTASQHMGLKLKLKIPYLNFASKYSVYKPMSKELAFLLLLIRVPTGFLYFLWTYGFASAAVEA